MYGYCHNCNQEIEMAQLDEFFQLYVKDICHILITVFSVI